MSVHDEIIGKMVDFVNSVGESEPVSSSRVARVVDEYLTGNESLQVQYLTFEHAKTMARSVLRKKWPTLEEQAHAASKGQQELFEEGLQDRYSVVRDGEDVYAPRHTLTIYEGRKIHARLIRISERFQQHADALAAFMLELHGETID